jgi:hypothetical protein
MASSTSESLPLPDDALIVRGRKMSSVEPMRVSAKKHHRKHGSYALSGWCAPGLDADQIARIAGERLPHDEIRVTTAGKLRGAGYAVEQDRPNHACISLEDMPSEADLAVFDRLFDPPQCNPVAREE